MRTKLNLGHDRLTLKIDDGQGNVTLSLSRARVSVAAKATLSRPVLKTLLSAFDAFVAKEDGRTYGDKMRRLEDVARRSATFTVFATSI